MRRTLLLGAALALGALASAQGSDSCATAQVIGGTGLFAFDNSAATLDGVPDPLCYSFGNSDVQDDVWFAWTAAASGVITVDCCGLTTVDTKCAVLDGSCAGPVLDCNDDSCGLQSSLSFAATAGNTYLLRIGTFAVGGGGTGSLRIDDGSPAQYAANGHYYQLVDAPGLDWDSARLAAEAMSYMGLQGHLATINDAGEDTFISQLGGVHKRWVGGFQNTASPSFAEPAGGWEWVTGEPMSYLNWNAGCPEPNNSCGCAQALPEDHMELIVNVCGVAYGWNDALTSVGTSSGYVVEYEAGSGIYYCFGDGTATACPCGNPGGSGEGCANSSGAGAKLTIAGSVSASADDLVMNGAQLLPGQPGLLFSGLNAVNGGNGVVFGDGLRCAGGTVLRLGVRVPNAGGTATWGPGLGAIGGWGSGDTRRFQVWYRDPGGSPCGSNFNLSHGVELVFGP
ncbi:MAG: hypothetical protein H6828_12655 [Planctomycetes bacterium]|nr:hypothetical protein [Planctomycetota bacterium]